MTEEEPKDPIALYFKDRYEYFKYWHVGVCRSSEIIFVVGINDKKITKETRIHVKEYIKRAPDLYPSDLRQLYNYYKDTPKDDEPLKLTAYGQDMITSRGVLIKMPEGIDEPDYLVAHGYFKRNILPKWQEIMDTVEKYERRTNRMVLLNHLMYLRDESFSFDWNLMNSGVPELLQTWNEYEGPKSQYRSLRRKYNVSTQELMHFICTRRY